jgi:ADP-heptose:LPS heptosyltransferase
MKGFVTKLRVKIRNTFHAIHEEVEDALYRRVSAKIKKKTLLIVKTGDAGDYIIFRSLLKDLRMSKKFRDHHITLLGGSSYRGLAEELDKDTLDEFIWADSALLENEDYFDEMVRNIFNRGFEFAFCPNYSMTLCDVKFLARCGAKEKVCAKGDTLHVSEAQKNKYAEDFTTIIDTGERFDFEFFRYKDFLEILLEEELRTPEVMIPVETREEKIIFVCSAAGSENKGWSESTFSALVTSLANTFPGYEIKSGAVTDGQAQDALDLCRKISFAALVITSHETAYHLAMAMKKRTVFISSGKDYNRFTPYPAEFKRPSVTLLPEKVKRNILKPEGVIKYQTSGPGEDISDITVEQVLASAKMLLKNV